MIGVGADADQRIGRETVDRDQRNALRPDELEVVAAVDERVDAGVVEDAEIERTADRIRRIGLVVLDERTLEGVVFVDIDPRRRSSQWRDFLPGGLEQDVDIAGRCQDPTREIRR